MRDELAQEAAEGLLLGVGELVLAAEEDHLVPEQCLADRLDGGGLEAAREAHAQHLGADPAGDGADVEVEIVADGIHRLFSSGLGQDHSAACSSSGRSAKRWRGQGRPRFSRSVRPS